MTGTGENESSAENTPEVPELPSCLTLEAIVDLTGELGHLNELVMLHLEKEGGFTDPSRYFTIITPVLDLLEVEIRVRCTRSTTRDELKLVVRHWIDDEIAQLR